MFGVDFSSAPGPRKPITVARTRLVRADQGTGIDPRTVVLWVDDFLAVESL